MPGSRRNDLKASVGDRLAIHGHYLTEPERDGEILEVLGSNGAPPYLVQWDDGRISRLYPGSDAFVERLEHRPHAPPGGD